MWGACEAPNAPTHTYYIAFCIRFGLHEAPGGSTSVLEAPGGACRGSRSFHELPAASRRLHEAPRGSTRLHEAPPRASSRLQEPCEALYERHGASWSARGTPWRLVEHPASSLKASWSVARLHEAPVKHLENI